MYGIEYILLLIDQFGLLRVVSIWLMITGALSLAVGEQLAEGRLAASAVLAIFSVMFPGLMLWGINLLHEYIPFLPVTYFGVRSLDIVGLSLYVAFFFSFVFKASSELTGDISK